MRYSEAAPAKVNLYLHVTGQRPDGYHTIESLFVFTKAWDVVRAEPADSLTLVNEGTLARALANADNLVMRAAEALRKAAGVAQGARLSLEKNIPVAAGLGGGSADAAATLRVLNRLWKLNWPLEELQKIGVGLGADVPACLLGRSCQVRGIGEILHPAAVAAQGELLLINPQLPLLTAEVFKTFDGLPGGTQRPVPEGRDMRTILAQSGNDLEAAAQMHRPEVSDILAWLSGQKGCVGARMTGSGPTCFGWFPDGELSKQALNNVKLKYHSYWSVLTSIID